MEHAVRRSFAGELASVFCQAPGPKIVYGNTLGITADVLAHTVHELFLVRDSRRLGSACRITFSCIMVSDTQVIDLVLAAQLKKCDPDMVSAGALGIASCSLARWQGCPAKQQVEHLVDVMKTVKEARNLLLDVPNNGFSSDQTRIHTLVQLHIEYAAHWPALRGKCFGVQLIGVTGVQELNLRAVLRQLHAAAAPGDSHALLGPGLSWILQPVPGVVHRVWRVIFPRSVPGQPTSNDWKLRLAFSHVPPGAIVYESEDPLAGWEEENDDDDDTDGPGTDGSGDSAQTAEQQAGGGRQPPRDYGSAQLDNEWTLQDDAAPGVSLQPAAVGAPVHRALRRKQPDWADCQESLVNEWAADDGSSGYAAWPPQPSWPNSLGKASVSESPESTLQSQASQAVAQHPDAAPSVAVQPDGPQAATKATERPGSGAACDPPSLTMEDRAASQPGPTTPAAMAPAPLQSAPSETMEDQQHNTQVEQPHNTQVEQPHNTQEDQQHNTQVEQPHNTQVEQPHNTQVEQQHNTQVEQPHNTQEEPCSMAAPSEAGSDLSATSCCPPVCLTCPDPSTVSRSQLHHGGSESVQGSSVVACIGSQVSQTSRSGVSCVGSDESATSGVGLETPHQGHRLQDSQVSVVTPAIHDGGSDEQGTLAANLASHVEDDTEAAQGDQRSRDQPQGTPTFSPKGTLPVPIEGQPQEEVCSPRSEERPVSCPSPPPAMPHTPPVAEVSAHQAAQAATGDCALEPYEGSSDGPGGGADTPCSADQDVEDANMLQPSGQPPSMLTHPNLATLKRAQAQAGLSDSHSSSQVTTPSLPPVHTRISSFAHQQGLASPLASSTADTPVGSPSSSSSSSLNIPLPSSILPNLAEPLKMMWEELSATRQQLRVMADKLDTALHSGGPAQGAPGTADVDVASDSGSVSSTHRAAHPNPGLPRAASARPSAPTLGDTTGTARSSLPAASSGKGGLPLRPSSSTRLDNRHSVSSCGSDHSAARDCATTARRTTSSRGVDHDSQDSADLDSDADFCFSVQPKQLKALDVLVKFHERAIVAANPPAAPSLPERSRSSRAPSARSSTTGSSSPVLDRSQTLQPQSHRSSWNN